MVMQEVDQGVFDDGKGTGQKTERNKQVSSTDSTMSTTSTNLKIRTDSSSTVLTDQTASVANVVARESLSESSSSSCSIHSNTTMADCDEIFVTEGEITTIQQQQHVALHKQQILQLQHREDESDDSFSCENSDKNPIDEETTKSMLTSVGIFTTTNTKAMSLSGVRKIPLPKFRWRSRRNIDPLSSSDHYSSSCTPPLGSFASKRAISVGNMGGNGISKIVTADSSRNMRQQETDSSTSTIRSKNMTPRRCKSFDDHILTPEDTPLSSTIHHNTIRNRKNS